MRELASQQPENHLSLLELLRSAPDGLKQLIEMLESKFSAVDSDAIRRALEHCNHGAVRHYVVVVGHAVTPCCRSCCAAGCVAGLCCIPVDEGPVRLVWQQSLRGLACSQERPHLHGHTREAAALDERLPPGPRGTAVMALARGADSRTASSGSQDFCRLRRHRRRASRSALRPPLRRKPVRAD